MGSISRMEAVEEFLKSSECDDLFKLYTKELLGKTITGISFELGHSGEGIEVSLKFDDGSEFPFEDADISLDALENTFPEFFVKHYEGFVV